jgi:hypothetical protein
MDIPILAGAAAITGGGLTMGGLFLGTAEYFDFRDDGLFNSGFNHYAGAYAEGFTTGALMASGTGELGLAGRMAWNGASAFGGSSVGQLISTGSIDYGKSLKTGLSMAALTPAFEVGALGLNKAWNYGSSILKQSSFETPQFKMPELKTPELKLPQLSDITINPKVTTISDLHEPNIFSNRGFIELPGPVAGDNIGSSLRQAGYVIKGAGNATPFDDLVQMRQELGLPEAGSELDKATLSKLEMGDQDFYGINAHGQDITLRVNAISKTHAEADAFQQAFNAGVTSDEATLTVDRDLCNACGQNGAVKSMANQIGINELTIISPSGTTVMKIMK